MTADYKPLVTVITSVYNCEKYLDETIKSVLDQDYPEVEYIVIDDGSTDKSPEIIQNYRCCINNILTQSNMGEQRTVNNGLQLVRGKYFFIVNADDPLLSGCISIMVDYMESHPDILCAYPDWDMIDETGKLKMNMKVRDYDFEWMVRHHTWLPSVGSIFRSTVIQSVGYRDESLKWLGDGDYWLRIGLAGKMAHVPQTLATWRYRNGQASGAKSSERAKEHIRVIDKFYSQPNNYLWCCKDEAVCWSYIVAASVTDSRKEIISYFWQALRIYPGLLSSLGFWDILRTRAQYVLRRSF
jgi:glycosyltransferase involved in cell wall biosynthesis